MFSAKPSLANIRETKMYRPYAHFDIWQWSIDTSIRALDGDEIS